LIEASVEQDVVGCFRCRGDECSKCGGTGYRKVKRCAGCGDRSGRPSKGGKALIALRGRRDFDGPLYCMGCHPECSGTGASVLAMLDKLERLP